MEYVLVVRRYVEFKVSDRDPYQCQDQPRDPNPQRASAHARRQTGRFVGIYPMGLHRSRPQCVELDDPLRLTW